MPKKQRMKLLPFLCILLLSILPCKTSASDLDIFNLLAKDVAPNVLLVLDISGSMGTVDVTMGSTKVSRLAALKTVVTEIINDNPNVKWGLFTFPNSSGTTQSGQLILPCVTRNSSELTTFKNKVAGLNANGGTPVSSALAEAGLYFAGQKSFFWSTQYTSPIDDQCQYSYIILLTDGFSSVDSGVKGGYSNNSTDKYNMSSKNSIFLKTYLNGEIIGDYITRKNLGSKLAPFVTSTDLTKFTTTDSDNNYSNITWSKVESGSPTLGDTNLRVNGQLSKSVFTTLKNNKTPYVSGYNASDPSRPFPDLPSYSATTLYLSYQGYLQGTQIFQNNINGAGSYSSDYLDDVAAFLSNEDLRPDLGSGKYEKQSVKTYTVGFMFSTDLLARTAIMGGTGGEGDGYFTADDYDELKRAFDDILSGIKQNISIFASPVVPVSSENSGYSGDYLYMSLFKPQQGYWIGNLKRYKLDSDHTMSSYQENGVIRSDAKSDWSSQKDGNDITKGGVVESLNATLAKMAGISNTASLRRIYTYIASNSQSQLAHANNLFIESNTKLTENNGAILGLNSSQSAVQAAITNIRLTPMGAIIHSEPAVVHYPTETVVFVGANDGFLHAFIDENTAAPEAWAFVMPEHLATITKARTSTPSEGVYYVDGYISISNVDTQKILVTGARRGGSTYAALDITSYSDPKFLFQIPSLKASEASLWSDIPLGQSWGRPKFIVTHDSVTGSTFNPYSNVKNGTFILVPGGYDIRYDTSTATTDISSPLGGVIVGVNAITGKPDDKFELLNSKKSNIMKHAVLDLLPLDMNSDGLVDTIYYGDLGGNLFYAWPYSQSISGSTYTYTAQAKFVPYLLFKTENGESSGRMFMSAPAVLKKEGVEYVFFGSGDRERPTTTNVQDRFYCVHNKDKTRLAATGSAANYLTETDLADVTENLIQSTDVDEKAAAQVELDAASGWYINLDPGEKVVGSPVAYKSYVAFTTYLSLEDETQSALDICQTSTTGEARLYIINYRTGGAAMDRNNDGKIDGNDRSVAIGTSIPTAPTLAIFEDGSAVVYTAVGVSPPEDEVGVSLPDDEDNDNTGQDGIGLPGIALPDDPSGNTKVFYWSEIY